MPATSPRAGSCTTCHRPATPHRPGQPGTPGRGSHPCPGHHQPATVVVVDLDDFKPINDAHGHDTDAVPVHVGDTPKPPPKLRQPARLGAMSRRRPPRNPRDQAADRRAVLNRLTRPATFRHRLTVRASVGVATALRGHHHTGHSSPRGRSEWPDESDSPWPPDMTRVVSLSRSLAPLVTERRTVVCAVAVGALCLLIRTDVGTTWPVVLLFALAQLILDLTTTWFCYHYRWRGSTGPSAGSGESLRSPGVASPPPAPFNSSRCCTR